MRLQKLILGCLSLALLVGCSGKQETATGESQFTAIYNKSFATSCTNCHNPSVAASTYSSLDMTNASAAHAGLLERVVRPASPSTCPNDFRVTAGQPTKSYLLGLLFADQQASYAGTSGCVAPTSHAAQLSFSADEKTAIIQWIQSGAAR